MPQVNNGTWIPLDEVVLDYLTESEQSNHKFFKLWQICFRGMEELGIDFFYQIKSVKLQVDSTKTVQLPSDYSTYSKVGVLNGMGEIIPFVYNKNLSLYADESSDRLSKIQANNYGYVFLPDSLCFYNYWNGFDFGNMYGVPGSYTGNFAIDEVNQRIILGNEFTYNYIVLEYVAYPKEGEQYYIPRIFRQALISWLSWKDINSAPLKRYVAADKEYRKRQFYNDRRLARARYKPFHVMEAYEFSLQAQRLTVKI